MDYNKAIILGRVTADPELRATPSGQSVASMGVATNRRWTDKNGQKQEEVEFHNIVLWGKQAEVANNFLQKGSLVLVEGRLQTRTWTDKDGQTRRTTQIVAENVQLGPKQGGGRDPKKSGVPNVADEDQSQHAETQPIFGDEEDTGRNMEQIPF